METEQERQWREDPNNWKWGMFYYNREDKRIMPPKRVKWMGWTVNFASPKSIFVMSLVVALAFLLSYFFGK